MGVFPGTLDFDFGAGVYELTSPFDRDTYILKLDSAGDFLWARQWDHNVGINDIAVDNGGNLFCLTNGSSSTDLDPGPSEFIPTIPGSALYLLQLNSDGDFVDAKRMTQGDRYFRGYAERLAVDSMGNFYSIGKYYGTVDFDPGEGVFEMENRSLDYGRIFIQKLDSSANFVWAKEFHALFQSDVRYLMLDLLGGVHIVGSYNYIIDLDPGTAALGGVPTSFSNDKAFMVKLVPESQPTFYKRFSENFAGIVDDLELLQTTYGLDDDLDEDGIPDRVTLRLMEITRFSRYDIPRYSLWNTLYYNYIDLEREAHSDTFAPYMDVLSLLLSSSASQQDALRTFFAEQGTPLSGEYFVYSCDTIDCLAAGWYGIPGPEPYGADSDFDEDGLTSLKEWESIVAAGGGFEDFRYVVFNSSLSGEEELTPELTVDPADTEYDFSAVDFAKSAPYILTISNEGTGLLHVNIDLFGHPAFSIAGTSGSSVDLVIERGQSETITLEFTPQSAGLHLTLLRIAGSDGTTHDISLSGTSLKGDTLAACGASQGRDGRYSLGDVLLLSLLVASLALHQRRRTSSA